MTNQEAIAAIKSNWPTENYTMLRDALNMAIAALSSVPAGEETERAFQMLEVYGVPRQRAKTVANGIEVLATRFSKDAPAVEVVEKQRREYYQGIVYDVCNILDAFNNARPGTGIVCGTADEPTCEAQNAVRELINKVLVSRLSASAPAPAGDIGAGLCNTCMGDKQVDGKPCAVCGGIGKRLAPAEKVVETELLKHLRENIEWCAQKIEPIDGSTDEYRKTITDVSVVLWELTKILKLPNPYVHADVVAFLKRKRELEAESNKRNQEFDARLSAPGKE
jgi:hypothetical protein